jgi:hypothetical protein
VKSGHDIFFSEQYCALFVKGTHSDRTFGLHTFLCPKMTDDHISLQHDTVDHLSFYFLTGLD